MTTETIPLLHKAATLLNLEVVGESENSLKIADKSNINGWRLWSPYKFTTDAIVLAMTLKIDIIHTYDSVTVVAENTSGYVANPNDLESLGLAILQSAGEIYDSKTLDTTQNF